MRGNGLGAAAGWLRRSWRRCWAGRAGRCPPWAAATRAPRSRRACGATSATWCWRCCSTRRSAEAAPPPCRRPAPAGHPLTPLPLSPRCRRAGRGAGGAGGEGGVLRDLVPAGRPHGAPRDRAGSRAAGGAGGDRAAVPAADAAGGGGAGAQLDPLRLPRPAHRRDPEERAAGRRRVPAGAVVGPGDPRPPAPLTGHPALNGPGSAVPCQPPPPSDPARGAALCVGLPAVPARLHRWQQLPLGAPGNNGGPPPPPGNKQPVFLQAGQEARGGPSAAAPEMRGPARGGRLPPGPAWPAAPGQGSGPKRRHLLQRGGHGRERWVPAAGAGTADIAGSGFQLVGSGRHRAEERGAPKAPHRFLPPHLQLASPRRGLRQKSKPPRVLAGIETPRGHRTQNRSGMPLFRRMPFYPPLLKARRAGKAKQPWQPLEHLQLLTGS